MHIQLKKLSLTNFKGIENLTVKFDGNTNIFAANEIGKSTLYTANIWLLTGKDEFDRKDFEIKNTKNKELNVQAHEVEALLDVDGAEVKIKRVYMEDWQKPRGQAEKIFEGHFTEFWYNDVPCSLREYQSKVDAIISPSIIKLITNPTYFNSLKWEDQRRGLLAIAGNINNNDVIDSIATPKKDYGTLINTLNGGKSLDEWRKEINAKKLLLKKAAVEYAPRINEAKRSLPEAQEFTKLEQDLINKKDKIKDIDKLIADASKALAEKQKSILQKQNQRHLKKTQLGDIRFKIETELKQKKNEGIGRITLLESQIKKCEDAITGLKRDEINNAINKAAYQKQIDEKNALINKLREDWNIINADKFEFDESKCECPTCKQLLPEENINELRKELLVNFNDSVTLRKADKVDQSTQLKKEITQIEAKIKEIEEPVDIKTQEEKLHWLNIELQELNDLQSKNKIEDVSSYVDALMDIDADAESLMYEITEIESAIKIETETLGQDSTNTYQEQRNAIQSEIDTLNKSISIKEIIEKTNARILTLEEEEKINAQTIATLEQQEFEIETFTRAKMNILEERVNSKFKYVQFRLFETQVNGCIAETCICEYKGVPYTTLNTAAKLLAGLDVLNTLSSHYNLYAPVFCDNRESVTWIPDCDSQIISLFVSPDDKKLRVEKVNKKEMVAA